MTGRETYTIAVTDLDAAKAFTAAYPADISPVYPPELPEFIFDQISFIKSKVGESNQDSLYKEKYWTKMNDKYSNKTTDEVWLNYSFWNQKDFKNKNINFINQKDFPKPYEYNVYLTNKEPAVKVFSFSEPIYYKNKEFAIFAKGETTTRKQFINPNSIIIMKKEKGKWLFFQEITNGDYY